MFFEGRKLPRVSTGIKGQQNTGKVDRNLSEAAHSLINRLNAKSRRRRESMGRLRAGRCLAP
jgi:hypothetical protein